MQCYMGIDYDCAVKLNAHIQYDWDSKKTHNIIEMWSNDDDDDADSDNKPICDDMKLHAPW